jgi:hypothetical protein
MFKLILFVLIFDLVELLPEVILRKENSSLNNTIHLTNHSTSLLISKEKNYDLITSRIIFEVYSELLNGKSKKI